MRQYVGFNGDAPEAKQAHGRIDLAQERAGLLAENLPDPLSIEKT